MTIILLGDKLRYFITKELVQGESKMKETKELLKFVIALGEALESAMEDKKFDVAELSLLIGPLMQVGPAFEGMDKIGEEIKTVDAAGLAELVAFAKEELDLKADNIEKIIEEALDLGVKVYSFIKLF